VGKTKWRWWPGGRAAGHDRRDVCWLLLPATRCQVACIRGFWGGCEPKPLVIEASF
jgi:hypothetical protein